MARRRPISMSKSNASLPLNQPATQPPLKVKTLAQLRKEQPSLYADGISEKAFQRGFSHAVVMLHGLIVDDRLPPESTPSAAWQLAEKFRHSNEDHRLYSWEQTANITEKIGGQL